MEDTQVQVVAECSIFPGKVDEFKNIAQETIDAAKAKSKAVGYRWYFNGDETKCADLQRLRHERKRIQR